MRVDEVQEGKAKVEQVTDFSELVGYLGCESEQNVQKCDVLSVISTGAPPSWHVNKSILPGDLLAQSGISHSLCVLSDNILEKWLEAIDKAQPKVVLIRALLCSELLVEILANRFPNINFVSTCHSALAFAGTTPIIVTRAVKLIELSRQYPNVYYGHADDIEAKAFLRIFGPECPIIWLPNVVKSSIAFIKRVHDVELTHIFLCCVWRSLKNMLGQIYAVAYAARTKRIRFSLSVPNVGANDKIPVLIEECRKLPEFDMVMVSWRDNQDYIEWMKQNTDIVMQCSFTESFNYVAWEAMDLGIPVIGSPAITYCPIQANPDSIVEMANRIEATIDDYDEASVLARRYASREAERLNNGFLSSIQKLLRTCCYQSSRK